MGKSALGGLAASLGCVTLAGPSSSGALNSPPCVGSYRPTADQAVSLWLWEMDPFEPVLAQMRAQDLGWKSKLRVHLFSRLALFSSGVQDTLCSRFWGARPFPWVEK